MNKIKNVQSFIKCVNDNYDLIIKIKSSINNDLNNKLFKFLVLQLRDTYTLLEEDGIPTFSNDIPEFDFFNKMLDLSKKLSVMANDVINNKKTLDDLNEVIDEYASMSVDWLTYHSLYLK